MNASEEHAAEEQGPVDLTASARGWHGAQLAVLGFIGLCGVLQSSADGVGPGWLQVTVAVLVLIALVLQCLAVALVGTIAWPLGEKGWHDPDATARARRRLRLGVAVTFLAVGVLALATTSSWWPETDAEASNVEVETSRGTACGELREGPSGAVQLEVSGSLVTVALEEVSRVLPVEACD